MKCKHCGKEFVSLLSDICPYCGTDNAISLFDAIFGDLPEEENVQTEKKSFDPYDWDNPDNCSDEEYMDDDDYDNFDN